MAGNAAHGDPGDPPQTPQKNSDQDRGSDMALVRFTCSIEHLSYSVEGRAGYGFCALSTLDRNADPFSRGRGRIRNSRASCAR
eukprot:gene14363-biopygen23116